ncbi:MAG: retroviral-like aspartic protease family protein [Candidatus Aenigmarchaeota archaeon]|nr:retroviral-like aspartic protease family protein [Candidatus Aenigmarchaeota archaeon]
MEIIKKAKISVNGKSEEVEAFIDTGADRTMIDEEVLLRLGAPNFGRTVLVTVGELKEKKLMYAAMVEIDGVDFGLTVIGGKKNLIGHDFLQLGKAIINEETGEVKFMKNWIEM